MSENGRGRAAAAEEIELNVLGRRMAAKCWGPADGTPTLALHGWLDNANSFDVLAPMLPGRRIVAPDFAGHGRSEHRQAGVAYLGLLDVQDALGVANSLGWAQFDLLGHSMGAEVGGNLIGLFPERVRRFVGIDGFPDGCADEKALNGLRDALQQNLTRVSHPPKLFASRDDMARRVAESTGQSLASAQALVARGSRAVEGGYVWASDARVRWSDTLRIPASLLDGILARYPGHILVFVADGGQTWFRATVRSRVGRFPNLEVVDVRGTHHLHMDEETARPLAPLITRFLDAP